jgi:hypothetical protein
MSMMLATSAPALSHRLDAPCWNMICREVGRRAGVPVQEFAVRNDMPCGSTIGPILAHNLGCRTVDVGMPQLSMHSIREMAGVDDVMYGYKHFREFFRYQRHHSSANPLWRKSPYFGCIPWVLLATQALGWFDFLKTAGL